MELFAYLLTISLMCWYILPSVVSATLAFLAAALAVTEIGLTLKAFNILRKRTHFVETMLPGGHLHAKPILYTSIVMIIVSVLALVPSVQSGSVISPNPQTNAHDSLQISVVCLRLVHRPKSFLSPSLAIAAFFVLPALLAQTVIGASWHAHVTSSKIPYQALVDQLVASSGASLYYHDVKAVMGQIIIGWLLWAGLCLRYAYRVLFF